METNIRFIPFESPSDRGWTEAWELYENAFPYKERRSLADHLRALADPRFEADGIWTGDALAGIIYHWDCGSGSRYVEHLAISPALRGQHLGSKALAAFCERVGRVILEIDPPVDEISIRRLRFYRRLGFVENPHEYLHPSFREPFVTHKLVLMSYPRPLDDGEARRFADFVRETVLSYSGHKEPRLPRL